MANVHWYCVVRMVATQETIPRSFALPHLFIPTKLALTAIRVWNLVAFCRPRKIDNIGRNIELGDHGGDHGKSIISIITSN